MAQFVELESGNLLSTSCITLISTHAGIKYDSEKIKVHAAIRVKGADEVAELISATAVAPWTESDNEVEIYNYFCYEREQLEKSIRDILIQVVRGLSSDLKIYYPSIVIRGHLERAAEGTAKRIVKAAKKMEAEQNE